MTGEPKYLSGSRALDARLMDVSKRCETMTYIMRGVRTECSLLRNEISPNICTNPASDILTGLEGTPTSHTGSPKESLPTLPAALPDTSGVRTVPDSHGEGSPVQPVTGSGEVLGGSSGRGKHEKFGQGWDVDFELDLL